MADQNSSDTKEITRNDGDTFGVRIDEPVIDEAVQFINSTIQETLYTGAIKIGSYVLERFFNNDPELASSRNPRKPASFQRLCDRADLKVDPTTLGRMVRVAVQENYLAINNINLEKLGYTHRITLLRVDAGEKKIELANKCVDESLSTRQFEDLVDEELEPGSGESADEAPTNPVKFVAQLDKFLKSSKKIGLIKDSEKLKKLRPSSKAALKNQAENLVAHMQEITKECTTLINSLKGAPGEKVNKPGGRIK